MPVKSELEYFCKNCGTLVDAPKLLRAKSPFDDNDIISGCPHCKSIDCFILVCDEVGCVEEHTCGFHVDGGKYRFTCHKHYESALFPSLYQQLITDQQTEVQKD